MEEEEEEKSAFGGGGGSGRTTATTKMVTATDRSVKGGKNAAGVLRPRRGLTGGSGGEGTTTNVIRLPRRKKSSLLPVICRLGTKFVNGRWNNAPSVRVMIINPG